jgi:glycosyltransferase involved in cell wall biosynthesis
VIEPPSSGAEAGAHGARVISTIIPCYNHAALLARAVESAAARADDLRREIIIVDDGSTDDTPQVCAELARRHPEVRVVRKANGGLCSARNAGIRAASGGLLHFLDADDYIDSAMYGVMAQALDAQRGAHVAYCGFEVIDLSGGQSWKSDGDAVAGDMFERLLRGNLGPVHSFLLRREVIDAAGFFDETLGSCEDWDYWLRIARLGYRFVHVPRVFAYYERQAASMSRDYPIMIRNAKAVLAKVARDAGHTGSDRVAVSSPLAATRRRLFDASYAGALEAPLESGRFGFILRESVRLLRADPASTWLMLDLLAHHKRAIVRGVGALLARAFAPARERESRR